MNGSIGTLESAKAIKEALWATGIAYGDPPRLWRVSPKWFYLWEKQWQAVQDFGHQLPALRRALDGDTSATYLRADFTLNTRGDLILLEINGTPVGDFGTQAVRQVYHRVVGLPDGYADPFPGAAREIADLLKGKFSPRRIVILLSPDRLNYQAEYGCLAAYFVRQGLECLVTSADGALRGGDVVYRTFTAEGLADFVRLRGLLESGEASVWPAFTRLEDKLWMTYLSMSVSDNGADCGLNDGTRASLASVIPWTWPVDPHLKVRLGNRSLTWSAEELMGARLGESAWVLKRARGAQGRGVAFSRQMNPTQWRQRLLEALVAVDGAGPVYVLQKEVPALRHKAIHLADDGSGLMEAKNLRLRLCVAYLVEGESARVIDGDATLRDHPLVHGARDAIIVPVAVRMRREEGRR